MVSPVLNKDNTERNYDADSSLIFSACLYLSEKYLNITNSLDGNLEKYLSSQDGRLKLMRVSLFEFEVKTCKAYFHISV